MPGASMTDRTLLDWFRHGLAEQPDGIALRVGTSRYTYAELDRRARLLAGAILTEDAAPQRVGILASRGEMAYSAFLAALYAGATAVPLNPEFPAERTRNMLAAARVSVLVADEVGAARLPGLASALDGVAIVRGVHSEVGPVAAPRPVSREQPAYIMFTSGSTGRPKGVPISHRNISHYLAVVHREFDFTAEDVFSQTFELTFDLSIFDMFGAWGSGGTLVCTPQSAFLRLRGFLAQHGVTVWFSTPSVASLLRRRKALLPGALPGVRYSLFCGEPLAKSDVESWRQAAPGSRIANLYGPTELTVSCSIHFWEDTSSAELCVNDIVPIGRVHPGLRYTLAPVGPTEESERGELCVTGPQMFAGYLDASDNEASFYTLENQRWYRTGDIVRRLSNGELAYIGRVDQQVQIRGVRVELAEINCALRRCAAVDDAATLAVDGTLMSFYTGLRASVPGLRKELSGILPPALVPHHIEHVHAFPVNSSGKIDLRALETLARQAL